MKRLFVFLFVCLILSSAIATTTANAKDKPGKKPICHKGMVIWVSAASIPSHLAHGDVPAVMNAAGEWVCPCFPDRDPKLCSDGTQAEKWDPVNCEWIWIGCTCEPTSPAPPPDRPGFCVIWDPDLCTWTQIQCEPVWCDPTTGVDCDCWYEDAAGFFNWIPCP